MATSKDLLQMPESRLSAALVEEYHRSGVWRETTLDDHLLAAVRDHPERVAAVSVDGGTGERLDSVTYSQMDALVERLAGGLAGLGVGEGDVVSLMLPNRLEFGALIFAVLRLGAVYSGIPASYGPKDVAFMLQRARSKVLVIPSRLRRTDHVAMVRSLRSKTPELRNVVVLEGEAGGEVPEEVGWLSYKQLAEARPLPERPEVDSGSLAHIGFTSGTTGEPKGVMNTHQTLDAVRRGWISHVGAKSLGEPVVNLIPSPVGHHTGLLWGALLSASVGGTAVYLDRWDPPSAAAAIQREGVTLMFGAPTFLQDLVRVEGATPETFSSLRVVCIPGAPIPRELVPKARERLGCFICPAWGMTEWGIGLSGAPRLSRQRMDETDGVAVAGCGVRVTRAPDVLAPPGEVGDLEIRGGGLFIGYYARPDFTAEAISPEGWFRTGDQARLDPDGYVTLLGRSKDIIIRGGENIPVSEIENLLYRHPEVLDVAVVGVPDERLGERACAVLVCEEDLTLEDVTGFLIENGLSRHFLPERLEVVRELPKTQSGKVRKFELRQRLAGTRREQ